MSNILSTHRPLPSLREIGVDLNGNLIVPGTMTFPADDGGLFPRMQTGYLRLSPLWELRLAPCQAVRETSGFIKPSEVGSELFIPEALSGIIFSKLQYGEDGRYEFTLPFDCGQLGSISWPNSKNIQPLSHWILVIEISKEWMKVSLSAKLHIENLVAVGLQGNFWSEQDGPTIAVNFEVDPITRAAYFGKWSTSGLTGAEPVDAPTASSLNSLDIANAMIGVDGRIFGTSGSRWVKVSWNKDPFGIIYLSYHHSIHRTDQDLLLFNDPVEPTITLSCLSIDYIQNIVRNSPNANIEFHNGEFGILSYGGGSGSKWEVIRDICVSISLNENGLHVSYVAHASYLKTIKTREVVGGFSLTWEVIILRLPKIAQLRSRVESLNQAGTSAPTNPAPPEYLIATTEPDTAMKSDEALSFFRRLFLK